MRTLLIIGLLLASEVARAETYWLRLLGTTDRHGHIENAALLGSHLARERRAFPGRVLLVDGGDLFTGTLESDLGEGAAVMRAMNALGYDAAAVGNHEFDFGPVGPRAIPGAPEDDPRGALKARAREARFPLLTANVVEADGRPLAGTRPYVVRALGGLKVALIGGTTEATPGTTMPQNLSGLRFLPLEPALIKAAEAARLEGAQVVVAVVHAGAECPRPRALLTDEQPGAPSRCRPSGELIRLARALAKAAPAARVNAIFGGHTHRATTEVVDGIPITQAPPLGTAYVALSLAIDAATHRPTGAFRLEPPTMLDPAAPADPQVARVVAPDLAEAALKRVVPVGVQLEDKVWRSYKRESPLGNLVADDVRAATGADVALMNGGGLRADLPAGPLSYGALFEALPFDNRLAAVKMTGAALERLFVRNAATSRGFLSIAGARVEVQCKEGRLAATVTLASGKALGKADEVQVASTEFLLQGGDDFSGGRSRPGFAAGGATLRDVVLAALRARKTLRRDELYDPARPRVLLSGARPVRCRARAVSEQP